MAKPSQTEILTFIKTKDDAYNPILPVTQRWNAFSGGILNNLDWRSLVVAGGAMVNCIAVPPKYWTTSSDIDLFVHKLDGVINANEIVNRVLQTIRKNTKKEVTLSISANRKVVTFIVEKYRRVQLILVEYNNIWDVINSFDIDACKVAWRPGHTILGADARFELTQRKIIYNPSRASEMYGKRLLRYALKGFSIDMGNGFNPKTVDWKQYESNTNPFSVSGIHQLMVAESMSKSVIGTSKLIRSQLTSSGGYTFLGLSKTNTNTPQTFTGIQSLDGITFTLDKPTTFEHKAGPEWLLISIKSIGTMSPIKSEVVSTPTQSPVAEPVSEPTPTPTPTPVPEPVSEPTPTPVPEPVSEPTPTPVPEPVQSKPEPVSEPTPTPVPEPVQSKPVAEPIESKVVEVKEPVVELPAIAQPDDKSRIVTCILGNSPFLAYKQVNFTKRIFTMWITLPGLNPTNVSTTIKYNPRTLDGTVDLTYLQSPSSMIDEFCEFETGQWAIHFGKTGDNILRNNQRLDVKKLRKVYESSVMRIDIPFYEDEDEVEVVCF